MVLEELHEVPLTIPDDKLRKLFHSHTIQLHPGHIGVGRKFLFEHKQARKIAKAHRENRGVRIKFSHREHEHNMERHGGSFKGFMRGLKKVTNKIAPVLKKVATAVMDNGGEQALTGMLSGLAVATGNPEAIAMIPGGVKVVRKVTGVGVRKHGGKVKIPKALKKVGKEVGKVVQKIAKKKATQYIQEHGDEMIDKVANKMKNKYVPDDVIKDLTKEAKTHLHQNTEKKLINLPAEKETFSAPFSGEADLSGLGKKRRGRKGGSFRTAGGSFL